MTEPLTREAFNNWKAEHEKWLDTKFSNICNEINSIKTAREKDWRDQKVWCDNTRKACSMNVTQRLQNTNSLISMTKKKFLYYLFGAILISSLFGSVITEIVPWKNVIMWLFGIL